MFVVYVLVGALILLACYEVWQVQHHQPTISEQVWAFERRWPPIGFLVGIGLGILLGHLFTI